MQAKGNKRYSAYILLVAVKLIETRPPLARWRERGWGVRVETPLDGTGNTFNCLPFRSLFRGGYNEK